MSVSLGKWCSDEIEANPIKRLTYFFLKISSSFSGNLQAILKSFVEFFRGTFGYLLRSPKAVSGTSWEYQESFRRMFCNSSGARLENFWDVLEIFWLSSWTLLVVYWVLFKAFHRLFVDSFETLSELF